MSHFVKQIYKKENAYRRKTVFLDRDGTLIKEIDYLSNPSQINLLPGVMKGIKKLNANNIALIVVTNQPVIARGLVTIKDAKKINDTLIKILNKKHAYINAIYFCPHHPERNHPDIPKSAMKYRVKCDCRKPQLAMLKRAVEDFKINLENAFIVGDRASDIKTGENLGIKTILVQTGSRDQDNINSVKPNYVAPNFSQAVGIICKL